jgi:hypothetical protein
MKMCERLKRFVLFVVLTSSLAGAHGETPGTPKAIAVPQGAATAPVLTLQGESGSRSLSVAELERLGMHEVRTKTFWPEDDGLYAGPLLRDVLQQVGLDKADEIRVRARDGFSQVIPRQDWERWPILLATRRDGQLMKPRHKGPLRIIYPRDMSPELAESIYRLRWVWLVEHIAAKAAK